MRIMFCTSDRFGSWLIRKITWSKFSHVAIIDGNEVIEAVWPRVKLSKLQDVLKRYNRHVIIDISPCDDAAALKAARAQVGKRYDLFGMLGIAIHRDWQEESAWWCSELAVWAMQQGDLFLFRRDEVHRITPQHLWMLELGHRVKEKGVFS